MKKAIVLAGATVLLITFSSIFYYKNVDFSNGQTNIQKKEDLSYVELPKYEEVKKENNNDDKKSWFDGWFSSKNNVNQKEEEQNIEEENKTSEKDISICNENGKIMILMYHKFAETQSDGWTRSFDNFKNDLQTLYEKNYYPINMSDYLNGYIDVPYGKTPIILTFDDGTAGQLSFERVDGKLVPKENTAVAIYKKFSEEHSDFPMRGTFYIMSTNFFGSTGTLRQRLEYLVEQGFEIGNQTKNHYALQKATSAEKVIEEVGGLAKFVDELIPGYVINSFSIPGGSMTKNYKEQVYSGTYDGFKYENKGVVLLYGSSPELSPINKELDLKSLSRVRVAGKDKVDKDFDYWIKYFDEHPEEKYVSDGDPMTFVIDKEDSDKVQISSQYNLKTKN